jgi:hypothetical protein
MTYNAIADMARNESLQLRLTAAAASEGLYNPMMWVGQYVWNLVAQPGWPEAFAYAQATRDPEDVGWVDPGRDEGVITDGMILSAVQGLLAATASPEPEPEGPNAPVPPESEPTITDQPDPTV